MAGRIHEVRVDRSRRLAEQPETGHNRWHPRIPPIAWVDPGDEAILETRDAIDGQLTLQSTVEDYGHRDMCLIFGYQDAAHFYYSHLGKKADDNANQIFIVNDKPRTKISTKTTEGTNWTDAWHRVKVVRKVSDGTIEVYWDDMKTPVQTATDKTFAWGRIGIGSFDDTGNWDDIKLYGKKVEPAKK